MLVTFHYPMATQTEFASWLLGQMEQQGWSQAELARKADTSKQTISRIISGERGIGTDVIVGIAGALNYPPEFIARMAGVFPAKNEDDPTEEELLYLYNKLSDEDKADIREWVRLQVEKNERKARLGKRE